MVFCIIFWFSEFFYFDIVCFFCLLFIVILVFCLFIINKNLFLIKFGYKLIDIVFCSFVLDIEWIDF